MQSTYTRDLSKKWQKIDTFCELVDFIDTFLIYVDLLLFYRQVL